MSRTSTPAGVSGNRPYDPLRVFEGILSAAPLNVTIYDGDLVVRDISAAAAALAGAPREALVGSSLRTHPDDCLANMERVLAGETIEYEAPVAPELCPEERLAHVLMVPICDRAGAVQAGMTIVADVTEERKTADLVEKLAFVDAVTELPNRAMFSMVLGRALSGAKAKQRQLALVWLNLDRFKDVNDALGQQAGDALLRAVGERLHEHVRTNDMVAHMGADEFALLLPRINSRAHLERLVARIGQVFGDPFAVGGEEIFLSASCGIAVHPNGTADERQLQENAHSAMRAAKELGGGACEIYDPGASEQRSMRLWLAREIRESIDQERFLLHYQPLVELGTMRVQAVEALARWDHAERGLVSPAEFIPFAEESDLIVALGRHLRSLAYAQLRRWHQAFASPPRLAFNVSAREVQRSDVCGEVKRAAQQAGVSLSCLEVEFTETAVLADPARAAEVAASLREAGATVALDDFGTGYSSLTHLRELPIDRVKIDRSFVASCLEDRSAAAILVGVTRMAHDLGIEVLAEGIETAEQLDFVRQTGCDAAQGYYLAKPLGHDECTRYLSEAAST